MHGSFVKQLVKSKSGLRIIPADEGDVSPFLMKEPIWVPDKQVSSCTKCNIKFGLTTRKHHCRRCGEIYCNSCSEAKQSLPRMCFVDPVRICIDCLPQTVREIKFFDQHLKTLLQGASFNFTSFQSSCMDQEKERVLHCRLSQDHRSLVFNGTDLGPVLLHQITDLKMFKDISSGNKSLDIAYINGGDNNILRLDTLSDVRHKERADTWLSAFHMGYFFVQEMSYRNQPYGCGFSL